MVGGLLWIRERDSLVMARLVSWLNLAAICHTHTLYSARSDFRLLTSSRVCFEIMLHIINRTSCLHVHAEVPFFVSALFYDRQAIKGRQTTRPSEDSWTPHVLFRCIRVVVDAAGLCFCLYWFVGQQNNLRTKFCGGIEHVIQQQVIRFWQQITMRIREF